MVLVKKNIPYILIFPKYGDDWSGNLRIDSNNSKIIGLEYYYYYMPLNDYDDRFFSEAQDTYEYEQKRSCMTAFSEAHLTIHIFSV